MCDTQGLTLMRRQPPRGARPYVEIRPPIILGGGLKYLTRAQSAMAAFAARVLRGRTEDTPPFIDVTNAGLPLELKLRLVA